MRRQIAILGTMLFVLNGCFRHVPVEPAAAPEGIRVRATLTDAAAVELGGQLGRGIQELEGDVLRTDTTSVLLAIRTVRLRGGEEQYWRGENFALPQRSIMSLEERRVDTFRSVLAGGALAVALYAIASAVSGSSGGSGRIVVPPPPQ